MPCHAYQLSPTVYCWLYYRSKAGESAESTSAKTRTATNIFGLGPAVTEDDAEITGARLPTGRQVLRCALWHAGHHSEIALNRSLWDVAKVVYAKVKAFYLKANIPMITERKACEKIVQLLEENKQLRKIPVHRRASAACMAKVENIYNALEHTFQLWPKNAEEMLNSCIYEGRQGSFIWLL